MQSFSRLGPISSTDPITEAPKTYEAATVIPMWALHCIFRMLCRCPDPKDPLKTTDAPLNAYTPLELLLWLVRKVLRDQPCCPTCCAFVGEVCPCACARVWVSYKPFLPVIPDS